MNRTAGVIVGPALLVLGMAFAQGSMGGMDHSQMGGSMPAGNTMSMTGSMDMGALEKLSGKAFDRAFLSMMIPHHQAAIDMARAVLPLNKDATVKQWATQVIQDQSREITVMTKLLATYGGADTAMSATMKSGMAEMATAIKTSKQPDQAFVQGMLPHHSSALDMAQLALQKSANSQVLTLARDIVTAQAKEMYDFRRWLIKRGA